MKSVAPAIKQYVSLYLHSKFIVINVVPECSIVLNIVILATARFVVLDTTPDLSNLKHIEISFYSTDCKFKSLEELFFFLILLKIEYYTVIINCFIYFSILNKLCIHNNLFLVMHLELALYSTCQSCINII